jgi:hypothetical protein
MILITDKLKNKLRGKLWDGLHISTWTNLHDELYKRRRVSQISIELYDSFCGQFRNKLIDQSNNNR